MAKQNNTLLIIGIVIVALLAIKYMPQLGTQSLVDFNEKSLMFGNIHAWLTRPDSTQAITTAPVNIAPGATGRVYLAMEIPPCGSTTLAGSYMEGKVGALEVQFSKGSSVVETKQIWGYCPTSGTCANPSCASSYGLNIGFVAPSSTGTYQVRYYLRNNARQILKTEATDFYVVSSQPTKCTNEDRYGPWTLVYNLAHGAYMNRIYYDVGAAPDCKETTNWEYRTYCADGYYISGTTLTEAEGKKDCVSASGGNGGGGSGVCTESWTCSDWTTCSQDGTQTRTCTDSNSCGTVASKPATSQSCTPSEWYYLCASNNPNRIMRCHKILFGIFESCNPYRDCESPEYCVNGQSYCSGGSNGSIIPPEGYAKRGETCGPLSAIKDCMPGTICIETGPGYGSGTYYCMDEVLDSCVIRCAAKGTTTNPHSCTETECLTMSSPDCYVPKGSADLLGRLTAAECLNCIPSPEKADPTRGAASCCSGQIVGEYCKSGPTVTNISLSDIKADNTVRANGLVESTTLSAVSSLTSEDLAKYGCASNDDCKDENCKSFKWLIENKYMTTTQSDTFFTKFAPGATKVSSIIAGGAAGVSASAIGCAVLTAVALPTGLVSAGAFPWMVWGACTAITAVPLASGGVAVGGSIGEGLSNYITKVATRDTANLGVCIESGSGGDFCSYFDWLRPALPENARDKACAIGAAGAFILLLVILRMLMR